MIRMVFVHLLFKRGLALIILAVEFSPEVTIVYCKNDDENDSNLDMISSWKVVLISAC